MPSYNHSTSSACRKRNTNSIVRDTGDGVPNDGDDDDDDGDDNGVQIAMPSYNHSTSSACRRRDTREYL